MTKNEFLIKLTMALSGLPTSEIEQRVAFYGEMIDDRMEEGLTEAEAVAGLGRLEQIEEQIIGEIPFAKIAKQSVKPKKGMSAGTIVLLIVGAPVWFSILLALAVTFYSVTWTTVAGLWAGFAALVGGTVGGMVASIVMMSTGKALAGLTMLGLALASAGLGIFMFFGCLYTTKAFAWLSQKAVLCIKKIFIKKESAK